MAFAGIEINAADDLAEAVEDLQLLAGLFGDLTPLMEAIGGYGVTSTQARFETETAPSGQRWKPSLRAELEGGRTLTKSTRLSRSMSFNLLGDDGVEWGTNLIYGPIHQFGGVIRAKDAPALRFQLPGGLGWRTAEEVFIPARPFLGIDETDQEKIAAITALVIEETIA